MKLASYLLFAGLCMGLLYAASHFFTTEDTAISTSAEDPDIYLSNAKTYVQEHAYERSLMHLDEAINSIVEIEQEIEPEGRKTIDRAVNQLKAVYNEILNDTLRISEMNDAFARALNALTYAEIKISEHYIETHDFNKAKIALNYGKFHLKNALKYSEGAMRKYEVDIYTEIDSLIENEALSHDEIIARLDKMLAELDTMVDR